MDDRAFLAFCEQYGVEPTDERKFFWLGALRSTREQQPVAHAYLGVDGEILGMLDQLPPNFRPKAEPLYRNPVAAIDKPEIPESVLKYVWENYAGDFIGFARWIEWYTKKE